MFLLKDRKSANGGTYEFCTLFETVRTDLGSRQRAVAWLEKLSEEELAAGEEDIEALLEAGKPTPRQLPLRRKKDSSQEPALPWELADLEKLIAERTRD